MKPWQILDRSPIPGGGTLILARRDEEYAIRVDNHVLMTSRAHGSEEAMAEQACGPLSGRRRPRVLIGGLGMGFTLRATLDRLGPTGSVTVAEVSPAVVRWNRGELAPLARRPLEDPRVTVVEADVGSVLGRSTKSPFDAILLDTDNGPTALARPENEQLYDLTGLALASAALKTDGVIVFWSAGPDAAFLRRLRDAGLDAKAVPVPARTGGRSRHTIFVAKH